MPRLKFEVPLSTFMVIVTLYVTSPTTLLLKLTLGTLRATSAHYFPRAIQQTSSKKSLIVIPTYRDGDIFRCVFY